MSDTKNDPPVGGEAVKFRMTRAEYQKLERSFTPAAVTDETSVLNAGYKLGVQAVLARFRSEFVEGL
jgi:hypothetical protein